MFPFLLALALPAAQDLPPARVIDGIEMETLSWGRATSRWSIDAQGNGQVTRPEDKKLVTRSFAAGTSGFRRVRVLLGRVEARGGLATGCTARMTDQPYGSVRWLRRSGSTVELKFDRGCRSSATRSAMADMQAADALVAGWGQAGTIVETRELENQR